MKYHSHIGGHSSSLEVLYLAASMFFFQNNNRNFARSEKILGTAGPEIIYINGTQDEPFEKSFIETDWIPKSKGDKKTGIASNEINLQQRPEKFWTTSKPSTSLDKTVQPTSKTTSYYYYYYPITETPAVSYYQQQPVPLATRPVSGTATVKPRYRLNPDYFATSKSVLQKEAAEAAKKAQQKDSTTFSQPWVQEPLPFSGSWRDKLHHPQSSSPRHDDLTTQGSESVHQFTSSFSSPHSRPLPLRKTQHSYYTTFSSYRNTEVPQVRQQITQFSSTESNGIRDKTGTIEFVDETMTATVLIIGSMLLIFAAWTFTQTAKVRRRSNLPTSIMDEIFIFFADSVEKFRRMEN